MLTLAAKRALGTKSYFLSKLETQQPSPNTVFTPDNFGLPPPIAY